MSPPRPGDVRAGLVGLAVAAVFLLITVVSIVKLTNHKYASHEGARAEATK